MTVEHDNQKSKEKQDDIFFKNQDEETTADNLEEVFASLEKDSPVGVKLKPNTENI